MRYYEISITDESGTHVSIGGGVAYFTSYMPGVLGGVTKPGALNVEMDIPVYTSEIPAGDAFIKIWGVDLSTINSASNLNFKNITIMAGMKKGLPLANLQVDASPVRNGVIYKGSILQAFGNWQGGEQSLDLIITTRLVSAPTETPATTKPIIFECKAGKKFQDAIKKSMKDAGFETTGTIDSRLVAPMQGLVSRYDDVESFSRGMLNLSKRIIKDKNYLGVKIIKTEKGYLVTDNSAAVADANIIKIAFTDLIGQPTWLDYSTVQMKLVMRSDIRVGDTIEFPSDKDGNTAVNFVQGRFFSPKNNIAYTGKAWVASVRHIGNYRQGDANSWVTVVSCYPQMVSQNFIQSGGISSAQNPVGV
jgi:hypothetical protein